MISRLAFRLVPTKPFFPLFFLAFVLLIPDRLFPQTTIRVETDIKYCTHDETDVLLDIAYPVEDSSLHPALLFLPGSGWGYWRGPFFDRHQYSRAIEIAAKHGYVAAAVDYRPARYIDFFHVQNTFPAQLLDVRSAVRWLRANAKNYNIDLTRIGAVGWSSGGHLALLLGLLGDEAINGENDNLEYSSKVQAVVSLAGPTELTLAHDEGNFHGGSPDVETLFGGTPTQFPEQYHDASPMYHISPNASPVLMFQGELDEEVPKNQASLFSDKMKEVGVPVTVRYLAGSGHFINDLANSEIYPFLDQILGISH